MPDRRNPSRDTVLDAILKVADDTSEIKTVIAVNSTRIQGIEEHLKNLNGKVATQEANGNTMKSAVDILINKEQSRSKLEWLTIENLFKLAFGILLAYLLYKARL